MAINITPDPFPPNQNPHVALNGQICFEAHADIVTTPGQFFTPWTVDGMNIGANSGLTKTAPAGFGNGSAIDQTVLIGGIGGWFNAETNVALSTPGTFVGLYDPAGNQPFGYRVLNPHAVEVFENGAPIAVYSFPVNTQVRIEMAGNTVVYRRFNGSNFVIFHTSTQPVTTGLPYRIKVLMDQTGQKLSLCVTKVEMGSLPDIDPALITWTATGGTVTVTGHQGCYTAPNLPGTYQICLTIPGGEQRCFDIIVDPANTGGGGGGTGGGGQSAATTNGFPVLILDADDPNAPLANCVAANQEIEARVSVNWAYTNGVRVNHDHSIYKSAPLGVDNAFARTVEGLDGDGWFEWHSDAAATGYFVAGLTRRATGTGQLEVDYGIVNDLDADVFFIIESNLNILGPIAMPSRRFAVSVETGVVKYYAVNGVSGARTLLHTSTVAPAYPLYGAFAPWTTNAKLRFPTLLKGSYPPQFEWQAQNGEIQADPNPNALPYGVTITTADADPDDYCVAAINKKDITPTECLTHQVGKGCFTLCAPAFPDLLFAQCDSSVTVDMEPPDWNVEEQVFQDFSAIYQWWHYKKQPVLRWRITMKGLDLEDAAVYLRHYSRVKEQLHPFKFRDPNSGAIYDGVRYQSLERTYGKAQVDVTIILRLRPPYSPNYLHEAWLPPLFT